MPAARHLLTVWNPSYAESAMDAHLEVLLSGAEGREHARAAEDEEPPYVWWAKLKSPNRQQPLPHGAEVLALQAQIGEGAETHLYLTDYRSLYVGLVDEITDEDVLSDTPGEAEHMPAYYRGRPADFWFRLLDIRRLVADDTVATIAELQKLRNVRYRDRPVSLYGGMVELPLLVTDGAGSHSFFYCKGSYRRTERGTGCHRVDASEDCRRGVPGRAIRFGAGSGAPSLSLSDLRYAHGHRDGVLPPDRDVRSVRHPSEGKGLIPWKIAGDHRRRGSDG